MPSITDAEDGEVHTGAIWQSVIDTVENTSTGHDHDGVDSKSILSASMNLDWDDCWADPVHDHSSNAEGGTLDWDDCWADPVHDHSSNAEGGGLIHRKVHTDNTERTYTGAAWGDIATTFTITHPANSLLIGIRWKAQIQVTSGDTTTELTLKITGSTLTTQYLQQIDIPENAGADRKGRAVVLDTVQLYVASTASVGSFEDLNLTAFTPLLLPDTSTTFTVQMKNDADDVGAIDEQTIEVIYIKGFVDD